MGLIPTLIDAVGNAPILPSALSNGVWWNQGGDNGTGDGSFDGTGANAFWFNKFNISQQLNNFQSWTNINKNGHIIPKMTNTGFASCMRNNSAQIFFNSSFTFIAAFQSTVPSSANVGIFDTTNNGPGSKRFYLRDFNTSGLTVFISDNTGAQTIAVNTLINAYNRDIIIAITMDAINKQIKIYLDGATFQGSNASFINPLSYNGTCYQTFGSLLSACKTFGASSYSFLYENVIYSDIKTKAECNGLMQYIADRYGIAFTPS